MYNKIEYYPIGSKAGSRPTSAKPSSRPTSARSPKPETGSKPPSQAGSRPPSAGSKKGSRPTSAASKKDSRPPSASKGINIRLCRGVNDSCIYLVTKKKILYCKSFTQCFSNQILGKFSARYRYKTEQTFLCN